MALVQQLRQTVTPEQHPLLHAQALLLQARLANLLTPSESALQLAQQAAAVLQHQVIVVHVPHLCADRKLLPSCVLREAINCNG